MRKESVNNPLNNPATFIKHFEELKEQATAPTDYEVQLVNPDGRPAEAADALLSTGLYASDQHANLKYYDSGIWTQLPPAGHAARFLTQYFGHKATSHKIRDAEKIAAIKASQQNDWNHPGADGWIPLQNVELNYNTGETRPVQKESLWTYRINAAYRPEERPSRFLRFLDSVFQNDPDKADKIKAIKQFFGLCLTPDVSSQKAMIFTGTGANGKGILFNILFEILKDASAFISLKDIADPNRALLLDGKTLAGDADLTRSTLDDGIFKKLVAGEDIPVKRLYEDATTIRPVAKLLFAANSLPVTKDVSTGYFRRWTIIDFPNTFDPQKNRNLKKELMDERDGIFNWILEGLREYKSEGQLFVPQCSDRAVNSYRLDVSSVFSFVNDKIEVSTGASVLASDLYAFYCNYCIDEGYSAIGKRKFLQEVCELTGATRRRGTGNYLHLDGVRYEVDGVRYEL